MSLCRVVTGPHKTMEVLKSRVVEYGAGLFVNIGYWKIGYIHFDNKE